MPGAKATLGSWRSCAVPNQSRYEYRFHFWATALKTQCNFTTTPLTTPRSKSKTQSCNAAIRSLSICVRAVVFLDVFLAHLASRPGSSGKSPPQKKRGPNQIELPTSLTALLLSIPAPTLVQSWTLCIGRDDWPWSHVKTLKTGDCQPLCNRKSSENAIFGEGQATSSRPWCWLRR